MSRSDSAIVGDGRKVFVIHGRDLRARDALFRFLRAIGLEPIEWSEAVQLTAHASPYIGDVLDRAFNEAQAVVALFTPDDEARLKAHLHGMNEPAYETKLTPQARPNVIFETGMALSRHPHRTVIVEMGLIRPFSDIAGRNVVRLSNAPQRRQELANRLRTAGCAVNLDGVDWHSEGDFELSIAAPALSDNLLGSVAIRRAENSIGGLRGVTYVKYPQVGGIEDKYSEQKLNSFLERELVAAIVASLRQEEVITEIESANEPDPDEPHVSFGDEVDFEITLNNGRYLSVLQRRLTMSGGLYPAHETRAFVVDTQSAYRYTISDLFLPDKNYRGTIKLLIRSNQVTYAGGQFIELSKDQKSKKAYKEFPDTFDFFLTDKYLVLFNLFLSQAAQSIWARIEFSEIKELIHPDGPIGQLLNSPKASA